MLIEFEREKIGQFFSAIKSQADEGLLVIKDGKMSFASSDSANVCFIDAAYNIDSKEALTLAIDPQKIYSVVNALKTKKISIDFGRTSKITGGKISKDVNSIDERVLRKPVVLPPLTFPVVIEVPAVDFIDILETIEKIGNEDGALPMKVWLSYEKDKFIVYSVNEANEPTRSEFDIISTEKGEKTTHKSGFGFDYLLKIAKVIKKGKVENVKIHLNTDYPCKIEACEETVELKWHLAPRIEDD